MSALRSTKMSEKASKAKTKRGPVYRCRRCPNSAYKGDKRMMALHIVQKHLDAADVPFMCKICNQRANKEKYIGKHMLLKHPEMTLWENSIGTKQSYFLKMSDADTVSTDESLQFYGSRSRSQKPIRQTVNLPSKGTVKLKQTLPKRTNSTPIRWTSCSSTNSSKRAPTEKGILMAGAKTKMAAANLFNSYSENQSVMSKARKSPCSQITNFGDLKSTNNVIEDQVFKTKDKAISITRRVQSVNNSTISNSDNTIEKLGRSIIAASKKHPLPPEQDIRPLANQLKLVNSNLGDVVAMLRLSNSKHSQLAESLEGLNKTLTGFASQVSRLNRGAAIITRSAESIDSTVSAQFNTLNSLLQGNIDANNAATEAMTIQAQCLNALISKTNAISPTDTTICVKEERIALNVD